MKSSRIQQVLAAAATLPAAKGRALVAALAISAKEPVDATDFVEKAAALFEQRMAGMLVAELEETEGEP